VNTRSIRILNILIVGGVVLVGCIVYSGTRHQQPVPAQMPPIHPVDRGPVVNSIVGKFGEPDRDWSTAYDDPRPPMVTRFLVYKRERVKFLLMPEAGVSAPPPYKGWRLVGMLDADSGKPLKADVVLRRMATRVRAR